MDQMQDGGEEDGAEEIEASRMTLGEHLDELRVRLMRACIAFAVAFVVLYTFREPVNKFVTWPYEVAWERLHEKLVEVRREQVEAGEMSLEEAFEVGEPTWKLRDPEKALAPLSSFQPGGAFLLKIKMAFLLSLFIAGPVFLWEAWMFIAAGLYKRERKVVYAFLPPSLALFFVGVGFGFAVMVPAAIYFTQQDGLGVDPYVRQMNVDLYLQFLRMLALTLGIVFQLPIFQVALSRAGIVNPAVYAKYRGHMIVITLFVAAVVTPPDPMTQILMAGPAIVLWEIGYWCSRLAWRGDQGPLSDELGAPSGA